VKKPSAKDTPRKYFLFAIIQQPTFIVEKYYQTLVALPLVYLQNLSIPL
jgi:hypothetical protein